MFFDSGTIQGGAETEKRFSEATVPLTCSDGRESQEVPAEQKQDDRLHRGTHFQQKTHTQPHLTKKG